MNSEWEKNLDIMGDIRYTVSRMRKNIEPRRPKQIECTEKMYVQIASDIEFNRNAFPDLIYPFGNPLNLISIQTDFSEWNLEDLKKGYKVIY